MRNVQKIRLNEPFYRTYLDYIVAVVFFLLGYFVFFTNQLVEEHNILNVWFKPADDGEHVFRDNNLKVRGTFHVNNIALNGRYIHYFDKNGNTTVFVKLDYDDRVTAGASNFIIYPKVLRMTDRIGMRVYKAEGAEEIWATRTRNYPEISPKGDRATLHSSENRVVTLIDMNNNALSEPVTAGEYITSSAFAKETSDYVAGFINGYFTYMYRTGKVSFQYSAIQSEINVVKGVGISEKGSFIAVLSGLRPEYISVYTAEGKILWYKKMDDMRRSHVDITLSERGNTLVTHTYEALRFYRVLTDNMFYEVKLEPYKMTYPSSMKADIYANLTLVSLAKEGRSVALLIDTARKETLWQGSFDGWTYNVSISSTGSEFLITTDKYLYCFRDVVL